MLKAKAKLRDSQHKRRADHCADEEYTGCSRSRHGWIVVASPAVDQCPMGTRQSVACLRPRESARQAALEDAIRSPPCRGRPIAVIWVVGYAVVAGLLGSSVVPYLLARWYGLRVDGAGAAVWALAGTILGLALGDVGGLEALGLGLALFGAPWLVGALVGGRPHDGRRSGDPGRRFRRSRPMAYTGRQWSGRPCSCCSC